MSKNLQGKTRPINDPYETYVSNDGQWIYKVLKKYQSPENEAANPYARWFMATTSPFVVDELGDGYVRDVKSHAHKVQG